MKITGFDSGGYYEMSRAELLLKKGKPDEKYSDRGNVDHSSEFRYTEKIYGINSEVTYQFINTWYSSRLHHVYIVIPIEEGQTGKELFGKINEDMNNKYNTNEYYYNRGITDTWDENHSITSEFGTDLGAIGLSVRILLTEEKIIIDANDLF